MSNLRQLVVNNSWIELAARWILGITFIYASSYKIISPADFAKIVYGYNLVPAILINLIAIVLPFLELTAGLALIFGVYPRSAAVIINILLLVFITALTINLIRGHEFDCGCFSAARNEHPGGSGLMLIRDLIYFMLGMLIVLFEGHRRYCFGRLISRQSA